MKKRFTEGQIVGFLRKADAGIAVKDLCRKHRFSEASYYLWRSKFGGMSVTDAKRLKEPEVENTRLKKMLADALLENEVTREVLRTKVVTAPARRGVVREMVTRGLSERRAWRTVHMSAAALLYVPRPDPDPASATASSRWRTPTDGTGPA